MPFCFENDLVKKLRFYIKRRKKEPVISYRSLFMQDARLDPTD
jgi:hypothetical protein